MDDNTSTHGSQPSMSRFPVDHLIHDELRTVASRQYGDFQCDGALLFLLDPYSDCLEPAFDSKSRDYKVRRAVSTTYGLLQKIKQHPHSAHNSGIATVAYQDRYAYSCDPVLDPRFDAIALESRRGLGITGSMMAVRLDGIDHEKLGVVVVHSRSILPGRTEDEEKELQRLLEEDLNKISQYLLLRRLHFAKEDADRYNKIAMTYLGDSHSIRAEREVCERFVDTMKEVLAADFLIVQLYEHDSDSSASYPELSVAQSSALKTLEAFVDKGPNHPTLPSGAALNRVEQAPDIFNTLQDAFGGKELIWCGVTTKYREHTLHCFGARAPVGVSSHWLPNDVTLLRHASHFLQGRLEKCVEFTTVLKHLDPSSSAQESFRQFAFLFHIVREFFGVDQLLLAQITQHPDKYSISVRDGFLMGFGDHATTMTSKPKDLLPSMARHGRQDVMVRILDDSLRDKARRVYIGTVGSEHEDFELDCALICDCGLKGRIYFLPCFFSPTGSTRRHLKCILHLGRADGRLAIPNEALYFLEKLAEHAARWIEFEEQRNVHQHVEQTRRITRLTHRSLGNICGNLSEATRSLGCTLFLNIHCASLLDSRFNDRKALNKLIRRFCVTSNRWEQLIHNAGFLYRMFAGYLGLTAKDTRHVLWSYAATDISEKVAQSLYLRVSQSNAESDLETLAGLLEHHEDMNDEKVIPILGDFFLNNVYLPGYGLTGWVIRYRCPMLLVDKSKAVIDKFFALAQRHRTIVIPSFEGIEQILSEHGTPVSFPQDIRSVPKPDHADHISEDLNRKRPQDTFLACPLDDSEELGEPMGVLRVSHSASLRAAFDPTDKEAVAATARHISHLLRQAFLEGEQRLGEVLVRRGRKARAEHFYKRLSGSMTQLESVAQSLEKVLKLYGDDVDQEELVAIQEVKSRLSELAATAIGYPFQRDLAAQLLGIKSQWDTAAVKNKLRTWLKLVDIIANVHDLAECALPSLQTGRLLQCFQVIEEVVKNYRRCQLDSLEIVDIAVTQAAELCFLVGQGDAVRGDTRGLEWIPYLSLAPTNGKGGGMKFIANCSSSVSVDYARIGSPQQDSIIVRIVLLK